jgi:hypothetical protein
MLRAAVAAVVLLLAGGCGSVCQHAEASATGFTERARPCGATSPSARVDVTGCEASLASCTAADLSALDAYFTCLDALPDCEPAKSADFSAAVLRCAAPMGRLSRGCFAL